MLLVACLLYLLYTFLLFSFIFFRFLKKKCNFANGNSVICRIWIDFHCRFWHLPRPQHTPSLRQGSPSSEEDGWAKRTMTY